MTCWPRAGGTRSNILFSSWASYSALIECLRKRVSFLVSLVILFLALVCMGWRFWGVGSTMAGSGFWETREEVFRGCGASSVGMGDKRLTCWGPLRSTWWCSRWINSCTKFIIVLYWNRVSRQRSWCLLQMRFSARGMRWVVLYEWCRL